MIIKNIIQVLVGERRERGREGEREDKTERVRGGGREINEGRK